MESNSNITVGWIGTGVMGGPMCGHLMDKKGYKTLVYNRSKDKAEEVLAKGAEFMQPEEIAKQADFIFIMLGYPHDVEEVTLGEKGIVQFMKEGAILVDHTTSSPGLAERIHAAGKQRGVGCIDAPVSGGDIGAKNGQVVAMCGGDKEDFEKVLPLLETYSKTAKLMGGAGKGQHTKAVNQIMISTTMIGLSEAFVYSHKAGLDIGEMMDLLSGGAAGSFSLTKLGPRMLKRDFNPGFYVEHFCKDLGIVLDEAKDLNLSLPGASSAFQLYRSLMAHDGGRLGTQAILKVLENLNNVEIPAQDPEEKKE